MYLVVRIDDHRNTCAWDVELINAEQLLTLLVPTKCMYQNRV
jgi:hypothetical protein